MKCSRLPLALCCLLFAAPLFAQEAAPKQMTVKEALELAARAVSREDLICVTGSFYLVGETIKHLEAVRKSREDAASPVG